MTLGRPFLTLASALLLPSLVHAAGLGEISLHSRLGEKLRAEINLLLSEGETVDSQCFTLIPSAGTDLPILTQASLRLINRDGTRRLLVESRQPINEPLLMLVVRAHCGNELQRDYILMPEAGAEHKSIVQDTEAQARPRPVSPAGMSQKAAPPSPPVAGPHTPAPKAKPGTQPTARGDRLQLGAPPAAGQLIQTLESLGELEVRMLRMESTLHSLQDEVDKLQSAVELGAQAMAARHELRLAQTLASPNLVTASGPAQEAPRRSSVSHWLELCLSALIGGLIAALLARHASTRGHKRRA